MAFMKVKNYLYGSHIMFAQRERTKKVNFNYYKRGDKVEN